MSSENAAAPEGIPVEPSSIPLSSSNEPTTDASPQATQQGATEADSPPQTIQQDAAQVDGPPQEACSAYEEACQEALSSVVIEDIDAEDEDAGPTEQIPLPASHATSRAGGADNSTAGDPIITALTSPPIVQMLGRLIARLEHVRYEDRATVSMFRTTWAKGLFDQAVLRLGGISGKFELDSWFEQTLETTSQPTSNADYMRMSGNLTVNWPQALLALEIKSPGFISLLNGVLDLEDITIKSLGDRDSEIDNYSYLFVDPSLKRIEDAPQNRTDEKTS